MSAAEASFLRVLIAAVVATYLTSGAMRDAKTTLHDPIGAAGYSALSANSLAGASRGKFATQRLITRCNAVGIAVGR